MPVPKKEEYLRAETAKERIYNEMSQWIMEGTLKPGEKIDEAEISTYFVVSRTPVREALQQLSDQRLVEVVRSKGSFVAPLSVEFGEDIYNALAMISGNAAKLACRVRTEEQLAELKRRAKAFEISAVSCDKGLVRLDAAFHLYIGEIAGNSYLNDYLKSLQMHACRFEYALTRYASDWSVSFAEHQDIIDAIEARDEQRAEEASCHNWMRSFDEGVKLYIEKYNNEI